MSALRASLLALLMIGMVTSAIAQTKHRRTSPARSPAIILSPNEIYRGPPQPPDRTYYYTTPSIAPPMERAPPLPPMSPRIGN